MYSGVQRAQPGIEPLLSLAVVCLPGGRCSACTTEARDGKANTQGTGTAATTHPIAYSSLQPVQHHSASDKLRASYAARCQTQVAGPGLCRNDGFWECCARGVPAKQQQRWGWQGTICKQDAAPAYPVPHHQRSAKFGDTNHGNMCELCYCIIGGVETCGV